MRKIALLLLTVLMVFSFSMSVACKPENENGQSKESTILLNGFNEYDDIADIYLNSTSFIGTFSRNKDPQYIVEGKASYKYWVKAVHSVYQPNFEIRAANSKTDITDVTEFGLYVHSSANYEFKVVFKCQGLTKNEIYKGEQTVVQGANNIIFPVEREYLQNTGGAVTYYDISFIGLKGGETLYFDNLYAKITTEEVEVNAEVQVIIDEITQLNAGDRTAVELTYAKYKALAPEAKLAVYNYKILHTMMGQFWAQDIVNAKEQEPEKLVFFDKPYGEGQVKQVSDVVESFDYVQNFGYGTETGSMKLTFRNSSETWNKIILTIAGVQLSEGTVAEFYIYNDSDQIKGLSISWTYPSSGYITLTPREWTKISCDYTHLTRLGELDFVGVTPDGEGQAPEGEMYISAIKTYNIFDLVQGKRTGEDKNTVFFFGDEAGMAQITAKTNLKSSSLTIDKTKKEEGMLKISKDNSASVSKHKQLELDYNLVDYDFSDGDVVVLEMFVDLYDTAKFVEIHWGYTCRTRIANKEWGTVVVEASHLKKNSAGTDFPIRIYAYDTNFGFVNFSGSIYLGKAKAVAGIDIVTTTENTEYTFGSQQTEYVGGNGKYVTLSNGINCNLGINPDRNAFNQKGDKSPQIINGAMRFYIGGGDQERPVLTLMPKKVATLQKGAKIHVTIRGEINKLQFAGWNVDKSKIGHTETCSDPVPVEGSDGYKTYTISYSDSWAGTRFDEFYFFINGNNKLNQPNFILISIIDISYENITFE